MTHDHLKSFIESAYDHAGDISSKTKGVVRDAVDEALELLDNGDARVAEKIDGQWVVHQWLKKAVLLSFRLNDPQQVDGGPDGGAWFDKVPTKVRGMGRRPTSSRPASARCPAPSSAAPPTSRRGWC